MSKEFIEKNSSAELQKPTPPEAIIILCGGENLRLKPVIGDQIKPLVLVGNKPILNYSIEPFQIFPPEKFIFAAGFNGEKILQSPYVQEALGSIVPFLPDETKSIRGTIGALKNSIRQFSISGDTLILNGDEIRLGFNPINFFLQCQSQLDCATVGITHVHDVTNDYAVILDPENFIKEYAMHKTILYSNLAIAGVMYIPGLLLNMLAGKQESGSWQDLLDLYLKNKKLKGKILPGTIINVNTPKHLIYARQHFDS